MANEQEQSNKPLLIQAKLNPNSIKISEDEDDDEQLPSELNTSNISNECLVVSTDKLSIRYSNLKLYGPVGAIQANYPVPVKRLYMYYFEIKVINGGMRDTIGIGFTPLGYNLNRQPGWEPNSYGYHGDDGYLFCGSGSGNFFGPTFTTGDTVGGGINYASQEVFFTKNGVVVGTVYKDVKSQLFPTIAVHSQNEEVTVNFGKKPFFFDIKDYEAQERLKQQSMIESMSLPEDVRG